MLAACLAGTYSSPPSPFYFLLRKEINSHTLLLFRVIANAANGGCDNIEFIFSGSYLPRLYITSGCHLVEEGSMQPSIKPPESL